MAEVLGRESESAIEPLVTQETRERSRNMWVDKGMINAASDSIVPDGVRLYEKTKLAS